MNPDAPGWPAELSEIFERSLVAETATLNKAGTPITVPLTPYVGEDRRTLDVTTGLTYPAKAERARRNPKMAMLFSDFDKTGLVDPPIVLVQGLAAVRDRDLQANTDRYLRLSIAKLPSVYATMPKFIFVRQGWYWTRIWTLMTPTRIRWWPGGDMSQQPNVWIASSDIHPAVSDPQPSGRSPIAGGEPGVGGDWRQVMGEATKYGMPVLTTVDDSGFPVLCRAESFSIESHGLRLRMPAGRPAMTVGPASITFHGHSEDLSGWMNHSLLGRAETDGSHDIVFHIDRVLATFGASGGRLKMMVNQLQMWRRLRPRLAKECERRGQQVPAIRWPEQLEVGK